MSVRQSHAHVRDTRRKDAPIAVDAFLPSGFARSPLWLGRGTACGAVDRAYQSKVYNRARQLLAWVWTLYSLLYSSQPDPSSTSDSKDSGKLAAAT